jgi:outer membrane protein assembly factor BamB
MKRFLPFFVLTLAYAVVAQADWKQWRGPSGQGHTSANLPTKWSESKNVKWRSSVPGKGWSSPVIRA